MSTNTAGWSDGYVTAQQYTAEYYSQLAPDHLNFCCALHGVEPAELGERFNYFELGCGLGVSSTLLASVHPQARFFANDFMPAHVAAAQSIQRQSGIDNLTLLESSFAELAEGQVDLPPMDFITLHGVYTWVPPQARAQIVQFIARYLKPGGVVYIGYNAMPGWAASTPLQRLLHDVAAITPGDITEKAAKARELVMRLSECGADYFVDKPDVSRRLAQIKQAGNGYLVHEYLHREWQPMYFSDVAGELSAAKLDFVGSSMLIRALHEFLPEQQTAIDAVADPALKETVKDFLLGTGFRCDLFVRGRRSLSPGRRRALIGRYTAAPTMPLPKAMARIAPTFAGIPGGKERVDELLRAMMRQPLSIDASGSVMNCGNDQQLLLATLACLSQLGAMHLVDGARPAPAGITAQALNRLTANTALTEDACAALASPMARSGLYLTLLERCVYSLIVSEKTQATDEVCSALKRALDASPELLQRLSTELGDLAPGQLHAAVTDVIDSSLPLWKRLKAIDLA